MAVAPRIVLRIRRLVVEGGTAADAAVTAEALRMELLRRIGAEGLPPGLAQPGNPVSVAQAAATPVTTPAGRGRAAASRILESGR